ncbi:MAG: dTDP-4-dehydrorhamnose 3,5-epimerase [Paraperlucidibaca sp.]
MNIVRTAIADVLIIEPKVFGDSRGFFMETWNQRAFNEAVGREVNFVQDNHSRSAQGVLRGLHFQTVQPQGKLVRVSHGAVCDIAVDVRPDSPTFGQHVMVELSGENQRQLWLPEGFAHGFLVLSESADFLYKTTDYYHPASELCLMWNDPALAINWPLTGTPSLSGKDQQGLSWAALSERL